MNDYRIRGLQIFAAMVGVVVIYLIRLFYLQVLSPEYALASTETDLRDVNTTPSRGIIFDRNEAIYVKNSPLYDVKFIPRQITIPDTSILEELLGMDRKTIRDKIVNQKGINKYRTQDLATRINLETYNRLSEHLWQFEGITVEVRPTRDYVYSCGAHFLGFINQASPDDTARTNHPDSTYRYLHNDLIGKSGLEKEYEHMLRGKKGRKTVLMDAYNRVVGPYADGKYDVDPVPGLDLKIGVDVHLQMFAEQLMKGKRGSVVAIEPTTGEILVFVSAPSFDPGLLTGSDLGRNYLQLQSDTIQKPLINRALSAQYPPGSIFKILQAMAAMSEGIADSNTHFGCPGGWPRGPQNKPACHGAHGYVGLEDAIRVSCNPFFAELYYTFMSSPKYKNIQEAYQTWRDRMNSYGIGRKLGVDLPDEKPGNLATVDYYNRFYRSSWNGVTIFSNAIGQGEVLLTPLQMCNEAVIIANRGYYITPHFLRAYREQEGPWMPMAFDTIRLPQPRYQFEVAVNAMQTVVESGTGTMARIDSVVVCGKTGTVESKGQEDHAVFICFAPKDNPKIAVSVIVENAGFGGTWAAPIASLIMEKHLTGKIKNQAKLDRILQQDFIAKEAEARKRSQQAQVNPVPTE